MGDINGDSLMDFSIGLAEDPAGAFLIYGSPALISTQIDTQSILSMGVRVPDRAEITGVGDFNGDGYGDWVMSNYYYTTILVLGRGEAYPTPFDVSQLDNGQWAQISKDGEGYSYLTANKDLVPIGDIKGDGLDDILAWSDDETLVIIQGRPGLLPSSLELSDVPQHMQSLVRSGSTQSTYDGGHIGDINADGFADVLFRDLYKLQVFFGSATGLPAIIDLTLPLNGDHGFSIVSNEIEEESEEASIRLVSGYQSRIVDDITGDGVDDLLVVSISHASGSPTKVQILTGHTGLWKAEYALDDPDFANGTSFEATNVCGSVGAAGDLNADGM